MHIICVNCSAFYIGKLVRKFFVAKPAENDTIFGNLR